MSLRSTRLLSAAVAAAALMSTTFARAETPPIRPGLWEASSPDSADTARQAERMKSFQNLPPEQRAKIEAMMKSQGVDISGGSPRFCISKASMDTDAWTHQGNCKTEFTTRTSSLWKWHATCTQPVAAEIDGQAAFTSPEAYTATITSKSASGSRTHVVKMLWKGADCGDIKPINPTRAATP